MSFGNIKSKLQSENGFTIVELLIVVVVIAILAAITIVSYNGITNRANTSSAASNVETVQKIAETYNSDGGKYPATKDQFKAGYTDTTITTPTAKLPTSITLSSTTLAASPGNVGSTLASSTAGYGLTQATGTSVVAVYITGTAGTAGTTTANLASGNSTGGVIISWDYSTNSYQLPAKFTYYGAATAASTFVVLP